MEQFDLEALMATFDREGLGKLVMAHIEALEITEDDLLLMLEQARMIYESELNAELRTVAHKCEDGVTFYIAIVDDNESPCAC